MYISSGLISVPLHVFVIASYCKMYHNERHGRHRQKWPSWHILMLSLASLLYVAVDVIPATILFTGLACGCETEDCMGDTAACRASRYSIFILMLIFYTLLVRVVKLSVKMDRGLNEMGLVRMYGKWGDCINW